MLEGRSSRLQTPVWQYVQNGREQGTAADIAGTGVEALSHKVLLTDTDVGARTICERLEREPSRQMLARSLKEQNGFVGKQGHRAYRKVKKHLMGLGMDDSLIMLDGFADCNDV
jgi:hypothetical protein